MWYYKEALKECPFCGNIKLKCCCQLGDFNIGYIAYIKCQQCGATQGWQYGDTPEETCYSAASKWNLRIKNQKF